MIAFRKVDISFFNASLLPILQYENEISLTYKLNSFSYEWLCTRPRFDSEAKGYSESERKKIDGGGGGGVRNGTSV